MSVRAVTWVLHESLSTGNDRLVLIVIADEADNEGLDAFPSIERIAKLARVPTRTVRRCIGRLEAGGDLLIRRPDHPGRGRFNRYAITMGRPPEALAGSMGWPPPNLDPAVRAEWEAASEGGQNDPHPVPPQVGDKAGDGRQERGTRVTPGAALGATRVAADPMTLNDTRVAKRRRGLDRPADPLSQQAAAARTIQEQGRAQIIQIVAEPPPQVDYAAAITAARAQLERTGIGGVLLDIGDGSNVRTPNEDDELEAAAGETEP